MKIHSIGESALFLEKDRVVYLIVHCNGFMLIELDVCHGSSLYYDQFGELILMLLCLNGKKKKRKKGGLQSTNSSG